MEPYLEFGSLPKDKQVEQLTQALKLQGDQLVVNGFRNNFDSYASEGAAFRPCITVDYSMKTRIYANGSNLQGEADRLFVPLNPIAQAVDYQRAERENDIYVNGFLDNEDIIVLHIPEGFEVEALPDDVAIDDAWGVFSSSARLEGDTIRIRQHIRLEISAASSFLDGFQNFVHGSRSSQKFVFFYNFIITYFRNFVKNFFVDKFRNLC